MDTACRSSGRGDPRRPAQADPGRWLDLDLDDAKPEPWTALGHGLTLRPVTLDEHRATVAAIEAERHDRAHLDDVRRQDRMTGRQRAGVA